MEVNRFHPVRVGHGILFKRSVFPPYLVSISRRRKSLIAIRSNKMTTDGYRLTS